MKINEKEAEGGPFKKTLSCSNLLLNYLRDRMLQLQQQNGNFVFKDKHFVNCDNTMNGKVSIN